MNTTITVSQFKITENCRNDSIPKLLFIFRNIYIQIYKTIWFFYLFYRMNVNNAKYTKSQPSKLTTAEDFLPKKNKEQKQQKIFKLSTITLTNYTGKKKQIFTTTKLTLISIRLEDVELHLEYPYCRRLYTFLLVMCL